MATTFSDCGEPVDRAPDLILEDPDLLALVAHELKNPITAIRGQAQLLRRQLDESARPERIRALDQVEAIDAAALAMLRLVQELLDPARDRRGRPIDLVLRPTDLVGVVTAVVEARQRWTTHHRLKVRALATEIVGAWNARGIERVVDNLLDNAVKYSPDGGDVIVTVARQHDVSRAWAVVEVRDFGIGIPAEDLPHIFDTFRRGKNASARFDGTGIGLASVRRVVELQGGTIAIQSIVSQGTTVTVRLPVGE